MFYTVPGATPLAQLMTDALTLAHATGHDVFNALDIFENDTILKGGRGGLVALGCCCALKRRCVQPSSSAGHCCCRLVRVPAAATHTDALTPAAPPAELKFGIGDGRLRYYLFNWRVAQDIPPNKVGLVML